MSRESVVWASLALQLLTLVCTVGSGLFNELNPGNYAPVVISSFRSDAYKTPWIH